MTTGTRMYNAHCKRIESLVWTTHANFSLFVCLMVINATFYNISVISWRSVLLMNDHNLYVGSTQTVVSLHTRHSKFFAVRNLTNGQFTFLKESCPPDGRRRKTGVPRENYRPVADKIYHIMLYTSP